MEKKILLVIASKKNNMLVNQVNKFFITQKYKNDERNSELLKIKKINSYYIERTSYFKYKTGIWLIGYDGSIKGYSEDNTLLSDLHNLIDNMLIRKEEMKKFKKIC